MLRRLIFVVLLCLTALGAAQPYYIDDYQVSMNLNKDGALSITERLKVTFVERRRGIFRTIPVFYDNGKGQNRSIRLDGPSCTDENNNPQPTKITHEGPYVKARIGEEDVWYDPGTTKTYVFNYKVRGAINWFDSNDDWEPSAQLYWNAIGPEWDTYIKKTSVHLGFPKVEHVRAKIFTGQYGSNASQYLPGPTAGDAVGLQTGTTANLTHEDLTVTLDEVIPAYSGLTVVVDLPFDAIRKPSQAEVFAAVVQDNLGFSIPGIMLVFFGGFWLTKGKDRKGGPIVVQYDPPDDLTGSELGTILDEKVDQRDIVAGIVSLAVWGKLTIEPEESGLIFKRKTAKLHVVENSTRVDLPPFESDLMGYIRAGGTVVDESDLRTHVAPHIAELKSTLYERMADKGYYAKSPNTTRGLWMALAVIMAFGLGFLFAEMNPVGAVFPSIVGGIIGLLIGLPFAYQMPLRKPLGVQVHNQAKGFEEFIRRAQKEELEWISKANPDQALFEKYLPHAVAMGLAAEWGTLFRNIQLENPSWYRDPYGRTFNAVYLGHDMNSMVSSLGSAATVPPRSSGSSGGGSGFSSGGGFSGGGFGGGGGGSW